MAIIVPIVKRCGLRYFVQAASALAERTMHDESLYLLNARTERHITWTIAVGVLCILAAILSVQCGKTATPLPEPPKWPPPPAVVDALPAQATPVVADFATTATPAAGPSPVTTTAVWRTDLL